MHRRWGGLHRGWVLALMVLAMLAIAWWDTVMEQAVAASVLYTLVILVALRSLPARGVMLVAAASVVLTVASHVWTGDSASEAGWINACISVLAVVVTAYLGLRMHKAQALAQAAQTRLMQLTRVGNMGALGASIAHEVNQPLAAIVSSGNACQRWLAQQPLQLARAQQSLQRMLEEVMRASQVINRVRGMARGEPPQLEPVVLAPLVEDILQLLHASGGPHAVPVRWQPAADLPRVQADPLQLQQVLGNVLLNASEAVQEAVEQGVLPREAGSITLRAVLRPDQQVQLTVCDNGVGLPPVVAAHVFEAFRSTKPQGMGLGLSLCRSMVEAMGGQMWAEARSDGVQGAMFHCTLPVAAAHANRNGNGNGNGNASAGSR